MDLKEYLSELAEMSKQVNKYRARLDEIIDLFDEDARRKDYELDDEILTLGDASCHLLDANYYMTLVIDTLKPVRKRAKNES